MKLRRAEKEPSGFLVEAIFSAFEKKGVDGTKNAKGYKGMYILL